MSFLACKERLLLLLAHLVETVSSSLWTDIATLEQLIQLTQGLDDTTKAFYCITWAAGSLLDPDWWQRRADQVLHAIGQGRICFAGEKPDRDTVKSLSFIRFCSVRDHLKIDINCWQFESLGSDCSERALAVVDGQIVKETVTALREYKKAQLKEIERLVTCRNKRAVDSERPRKRANNKDI